MSVFADRLTDAARRWPAKTAVVDADRDRRLSYAELDALVDRVAVALAVEAGAVVSSQLPNGIAAVALALAVGRADAMHNPIVTSHRDHELGHIRREATPARFVDDADDVIFDARRSPSPAPPSRTPSRAPSSAPARPDDRAPRFLLYTSGSTAAPKGVLHTDATLAAECAAQAAYHRLRVDDVFVVPSSVGHVSGLLYGVLLPVWLGATTVLMATWDPERFVALIERERGTFSGGATPFLQGLVDVARTAPARVATMRAFPCGGADVPPELVRRALALGVRTGRGYGSTEFPSITSAAGPDHTVEQRADTDGRAIGDNEVRIVDGEVQARGPELFIGYRDPSLDADALTPDGWFRTGDLGVVDRDGYLTMTGRLKDVIVRSGEKISAREVEELLSRHPQVASVAVIAIPDERTGERAVACVVARGNEAAPTLSDLGAFLSAAGLSTRKLPEQVEVLDELPMTPAGKVDKRVLRERVAP